MAICLPQAVGVPFAGGPPVWWNTVDGSLPALNQRLDDPRWNGCTRVGFDGPWASAAGEEAAFRALHAVEGGQTALYLSWTVKADNTQDAGADRVTVGFRTPSGNAYAFRLEAFPLQVGPNPFRPLANSSMFQVGNPVSQPAPAWVGAYGRVISSGGSVWAIQLRVPIRNAGPDVDANGIHLDQAFKFWFEIRVMLGGGGPYTVALPGPNVAGNPVLWDDATIGGVGCGQVVSIDSSRIRTNNTPSNRIRFGMAQTNELIAEPLNSTGNQVAGGAIAARYYIANWGSIPMDPNNATNLWTEIPNGPANNPNPINNGSSGLISLSWIVQNPFLQDFINGSRWHHQCMLVELSGGGLAFSPASAFRNMEFVNASTFEREAQISVRGLADPGTPQRDVYLLVMTTNMPERVEPRPKPRDPDLQPTVGLSKPQGENGGGGEGEYDAYATDLSGFDLVARDEPTYVVHVFHDTGVTDAETGLPVLAAQTPFGYVVGHEGPLRGWAHDLGGATVSQVGPNLYRLRVPTGGEAVVSTRIEAVERGLSWWERLLRWVLALLRHLLRWLRRLLRR
jgi:hypothetical protein